MSAAFKMSLGHNEDTYIVLLPPLFSILRSYTLSKSIMLLTLFLVGAPLVQAQAPPINGDNGAVGGIFGMSSTRNLNTLGKTGKGYSPAAPEMSGKGANLLSSLLPKLVGKGAGESGIGGLLGALGKSGDMALEKALGGAFGSKGPEGVTTGTLTDEQWADPGTGPYPAKYFTGICAG